MRTILSEAEPRICVRSFRILLLKFVSICHRTEDRLYAAPCNTWQYRYVYWYKSLYDSWRLEYHFQNRTNSSDRLEWQFCGDPFALLPTILVHKSQLKHSR